MRFVYSAMCFVVMTVCSCGIFATDVESGVLIESDNEPVVVECANDDDCQIDKPCTGREVCVQGLCFPGPGISLFDGLQCTDDICDLKTGEISHKFVNVDDTDPCTTDGCTEGVGIWHKPILTDECGYAKDCVAHPDALSIQHLPCTKDADCDTGTECMPGECDLKLNECRVFLANEGDPCEFGGTCDAELRCCTPL